MDLELAQKIDEVIIICKKHHVKRLYAYGSVCTDKFNEKSDIDFIIAFEPKYFDGYVENYFDLQENLHLILGRNIDLVAEETIQNPYFVKVVNQTKTVIYE